MRSNFLPGFLSLPVKQVMDDPPTLPLQLKGAGPPPLTPESTAVTKQGGSIGQRSAILIFVTLNSRQAEDNFWDETVFIGVQTLQPTDSRCPVSDRASGQRCQLSLSGLPAG